METSHSSWIAYCFAGRFVSLAEFRMSALVIGSVGWFSRAWVNINSIVGEYARGR